MFSARATDLTDFPYIKTGLHIENKTYLLSKFGFI